MVSQTETTGAKGAVTHGGFVFCLKSNLLGNTLRSKGWERLRGHEVVDDLMVPAHGGKERVIEWGPSSISHKVSVGSASKPRREKRKVWAWQKQEENAGLETEPSTSGGPFLDVLHKLRLCVALSPGEQCNHPATSPILQASTLTSRRNGARARVVTRARMRANHGGEGSLTQGLWCLSPRSRLHVTYVFFT